MRDAIEAKLKQAKAQVGHWTQQQAIAGIQVERWDAVVQVCEELLAAEEAPPEGKTETPPAE